MSFFKNKSGKNITLETSICEVPLEKTFIIIGLLVANVGTDTAYVSVYIENDAFLVKDVPVPVGSTLSILDGKIVLMPEQNILSSSTSPVDIILSYMEESEDSTI